MQSARRFILTFALSVAMVAVLSLSLLAQVQTASCTTALLIIDVQNIWLRGAMQTIDDVHIVDKIELLLGLTRGTGIHIVFVADVSRRGQVSEWSLGMPSRIAPLDGELLNEKTVGDGFRETTLDEELTALGVTRLLISGLASHSCVKDTVDGARRNGYEVVIIADGHTGADEPLLGSHRAGCCRKRRPGFRRPLRR